MYRVSLERTHLDSRFHLRQQEYQLNRIQNQIASQRKIIELRDDPTAASQVAHLESYLNRLETFAENSQLAINTYQYTEGYIRNAVDIMQRVRELAVQSAHGIYTAQQRQIIATEVNELLEQMLAIANATSPTGEALFGGTRIDVTPFVATYTRSESGAPESIASVRYAGNIESRYAEISERDHISVDFPGNRVFWAQQQQIYSNVDSSAYLATSDSRIYIDGVAIDITIGDNIGAIVSKINNSAAPVRASVNSLQNGLILETTTPHQIWLEEDGEVLQDLGILAEPEADSPPNNIAASAEVFGGSLFDSLISFRDALDRNDAEIIGGQIIQFIDESLSNVLTNVASLGARSSRASSVQQRLQYEIPEVGGNASQQRDIDFTEAVTELRTKEFTHQAALGATARILPRTLLDFLR